MNLYDTQYWLGALSGIVGWLLIIDAFWKRRVEKRLDKLEAQHHHHIKEPT